MCLSEATYQEPPLAQQVRLPCFLVAHMGHPVGVVVVVVGVVVGAVVVVGSVAVVVVVGVEAPGAVVGARVVFFWHTF